MRHCDDCDDIQLIYTAEFILVCRFKAPSILKNTFHHVIHINISKRKIGSDQLRPKLKELVCSHYPGGGGARVDSEGYHITSPTDVSGE